MACSGFVSITNPSIHVNELIPVKDDYEIEINTSQYFFVTNEKRVFNE